MTHPSDASLPDAVLPDAALPDPARPEDLAFLLAHGADAAGHSGEGLLAHLRGTARLLLDWGAREPLCRAGLFHSVYGTESYTGAILPPGLRTEVAALIGEEAEAIAWLFGAMSKGSLYENLDGRDTFCLRDRFGGPELPLSTAELADLLNLTVANWLEQRPRVSPIYRFHRKEELSLMRPRLLPAARQALEEAYGLAPLAPVHQRGASG